MQTAELSDVAANLLRDRLGLHGADANGSNTIFGKREYMYLFIVL